jgi:alpha-mannosidase
MARQSPASVVAQQQKTLHMIGNAHIDPVWLWRWPEGLQTVLATFRSALDRMNEREDFTFTASSAVFYDWVERLDPTMFAEIQARVKEGRWAVVGGWWVEPDCNIPGGESFVRHGLISQRYFKAKFGDIVQVGYNPDSFGHHVMLPQILRGSGMDSYVMMRPRDMEATLPRLFWWQSPDGSRVLTARIPFEYCAWSGELSEHVHRCADQLEADGLPGIMCFYGVGNHGGGPTILNLDSLDELRRAPELPRLPYSTPQRYLDDMRAAGTEQLPVVTTDLQHHARGCYAAQSDIKRLNRQTEWALLSAEKYATLAQRLIGLPYPAADLTRAWKNVLFNQFHDIMAGTALPSAYDDAAGAFGEARSIADRAATEARQAIAWNIGISLDTAAQPIVVFNSHSWPARLPVEVEFGHQEGSLALLDDHGQEVPMQLVESEAVTTDRRRLLFTADVPALGYRVYRLMKDRAATRTVLAGGQGTAIESRRYRLTLDPATGWIAELIDKTTGRSVFSGPAGRPVVLRDRSDTWSHEVDAYTKEIGEFKAARVTIVERGPVRSVIRAESQYRRSTLVQEFQLYHTTDRLDVQVTVDWQEQHKALKLRFPFAPTGARATYEIPYGHIERPLNGHEEPGGSWIDIAGADGGFSLLNDAKYSYDVQPDSLGLTVLRSAIYAHHDPRVPEPDAVYHYQDQGRQSFAYSLVAHKGSWQRAETVRRAAELNAPAVALLETYHPAGRLPQSQSLATVDGSTVIISALKRHEDDQGTIVRLHETAGQPATVQITLDFCDRIIEARLRGNEIKTFLVPDNPAVSIREVNLLEF